MRSLALAILLAITFAAPSVHAQSANTTKQASALAAQLKKDGDESFLALRYADALRAYEAAYKLQPNPALHYNRGRALEALERYAEAVDAFDSFLREAPAELRERTSKLGEHVTSLRQKVALLDLRITPAGARVLLRSIAIGISPLRAPLRVNAGRALLEVEAENREPVRRELELKGGTTQIVTVDLKDRTTPVVAEETSGGVTSRWWFWVGTGALVVGAGVVTALLLTQPEEARRGDIGTGRMTAPLLRF